MRKLVSFFLLLALVSLSLGNVIPVAAAGAQPASSPVSDRMFVPGIEQPPSVVSTNVTLDVWHITFETKGPGATAGWTQGSGLDTHGSATLSVSGNGSGALVLVENAPLILAGVSGNSTSTVKSSARPVSGNISGSLDYYVYADVNGDGLVDYNLSVPLTQESLIATEWLTYVPVLQDGQVKWMINQDFHGFAGGTWHTWDEYKSVSGNDTIVRLGVALSGAVALQAAVNSITLGTTTYEISGIQDAIDRAAEGDTVSVHPGLYDEFIDVNKSLTVKSASGNNTAFIQPAAIPEVADELIDNFGQVVLISAPGAVFEGFNVVIDGYLNEQHQVPDTGIIAVLPELQTEASSSQFLGIFNNNVQIKQASMASGIVALNYTGKTYITDNMIAVSSNITDESGSTVVSGIEVSGCEYVALVGNNINLDINSIRPLGIYASLSGTVLAYDNLVTVKTGNVQAEIEGVYFDRVANVLAAENTVDLKAGGNFSYLEGIGVWDWSLYTNPPENYTGFVFDRAMVNDNKISCTLAVPEGEAPEPWGPHTAELDGIWIESGSRADVNNNTIVTVADCLDFAYIDGITVVKISGNLEINENKITQDGAVINTGAPEDIFVDDLNRHAHSGVLETQDEDIFDIIGSIAFTTGAVGYGIGTNHTSQSMITNNTVDGVIYSIAVGKDVQESAGVAQTEVTGGAWSEGIRVWNAENPQISENHVSVASQLVSANITEAENPSAGISGLSMAMGLVLNKTSGAVVQENSLKANAAGIGLAAAVSPQAAFSNNLVLDTIQSTLLTNLSDIISQVAGQTGNVDLQGRPQANMSVSQAVFGIVGLGILANNSPGIVISDNDPVTGIARGDVYSISMDEAEILTSSALSQSIALGLGGGILLTGCEGASIIDNGTGLTGWVEERPYNTVPENGVVGHAVIQTNIQTEENDTDQSISATALSAGISFGILVLKTSSIGVTAVSSSVTIRGNHVVTDGNVQTNMSARSSLGGGTVSSQGVSLSLRLGIGTMVDKAVIEGNIVSVADISRIGNLSRSLQEETVAGITAAAGIGLGIFTYGGTANQILNNHVECTAESLVRTSMVNGRELEAQDASGLSGDLSLSAGIVSIGGIQHTIQGNYSTAKSLAIAEVEVASTEPLDKAAATGLAVTLGSGLVLMGNILPLEVSTNANAITVTDNHFEAVASGGIETRTIGYFLDSTLIGLGFQVNALILASECNFNYNDVVSSNVTEDQSTDLYTAYYKFGLLNLSSRVNARYNYWGDSTGPSGIASGNGTALGEMSLSGENISLNTPYSWWLSHPIADLLNNNVGYYGFGYQLHKGWNTLSVPMALENPLWTTSDKTGIADQGLDWEIAYYYDPSLTQPWVQITKDIQYQLKPLEGIYVKMKSDGMVFLNTSPAISMPSRSLKEKQSWFLIGPSPYGDNFPFTTYMMVDIALKTIEKNPDGLVGYDLAVSPAVGDQAPWSYTAGQPVSSMHYMLAGKAYWVFMENKDTLAGSMGTPMPARLPIGNIAVGIFQGN